MSETVTLDVVARLSGVSAATASRVLNDRPGVRDDVRQRVRLIADSLGFRPNRMARNLAGGRASVIGFVIPSTELRVDPYGASMTHAVGRAAAQRDQALMLHLAEDEPGSTVHHILRDGIIDGLLISTVAVGKPWVDELFDAGIATVVIGSHPVRADVLGVDVENLDSSSAAVRHLFEQGCARVGIITGPLDRFDARARLEGYRLAHSQAGRAVDENLVVGGDFTRQSGAVAAKTLVALGVDGIFASNDEMALGVMWSLAHEGVRIPSDVALVGFDGTSANDFLEPTLTSVCQPFDLIATTAIEKLLEVVEGRSGGSSVTLAPELVVGGSSRRVTTARGRSRGARDGP